MTSGGRQTAIRACVLSAWLLTLSAAAHAADAPPNPDPLEPVNRITYRFNDFLDTWLLRPVARGYEIVTPRPVRTGVGNFFSNLTYPVVIVNDVLQGKLRQGARDTGRFILNSTVGIAGIFDPATRVGLEEHNEDLGQTLGKWGLPQGPYLVVPLFGPRTFRSGAGDLVDTLFNPLLQYDDSSVRFKAYMFSVVHTRSTLLRFDEEINRAFDEYAFVRDSYLQNRGYLLRDGAEAEEDLLFDEEFDAEFEEEFGD